MEKSLRKHHKLIGGFFGFNPEISWDLKQALQENSEMIFKDIHQGKAMIYTKMSPSFSSCTQSKRRTLGCAGLFEPFDFNSEFRQIKHDEKTRLTSIKSGKGFDKSSTSVVGSFTELQLRFERYRQKTLDHAIAHSHVFRRGQTEVLAEALAEPSKFRILTIGDGYTYTALQPLQGALIDGWKKQPYSTMRDPDLTQKVNQLDKRSLPNSSFVSVDYESATDYLKSSVTLTILQTIRHTQYGELAYQSMSQPTTVIYPNEKYSFKERIPDCTQKNGQLMGHPLSFPLLCVANLTEYQVAYDRYVDAARKVFERVSDRLNEITFEYIDYEAKPENNFRFRYGGKKGKRSIYTETRIKTEQEKYKNKIKNLKNTKRKIKKILDQREKERRTQRNNVIVNGDDMLFKSSRTFYEEFFIPTVTELGLIPSRGKNYFSEFFGMINSQTFKKQGASVKRSGYFNQKVLTCFDVKNPNS